jgi:hypothetical protein
MALVGLKLPILKPVPSQQHQAQRTHIQLKHQLRCEGVVAIGSSPVLVAKFYQKSFSEKNITFPRESEHGQNSKRGKASVQTKDEAPLLPLT